jgi:hypothetical protein
MLRRLFTSVTLGVGCPVGCATSCAETVCRQTTGATRQRLFRRRCPVIRITPCRVEARVARAEQEYRLTSAQLEEAIAKLQSAETTTDVDHPNLASWRIVITQQPQEIASVFIGAINDHIAGSADSALRRAISTPPQQNR